MLLLSGLKLGQCWKWAQQESFSWPQFDGKHATMDRSGQQCSSGHRMVSRRRRERGRRRREPTPSGTINRIESSYCCSCSCSPVSVSVASANLLDAHSATSGQRSEQQQEPNKCLLCILKLAKVVCSDNTTTLEQECMNRNRTHKHTAPATVRATSACTCLSSPGRENLPQKSIATQSGCSAGQDVLLPSQ